MSTNPGREVADLVTRWAAAGLISEDQRAAIVEYEARPAAAAPAHAAPGVERPRRIPVVAEALGYLGATLAIVGLALVVARAWSDLGAGGRLAVSGGTAAVLLAAGALVRETEAVELARLRASLWLAGTAAATLFVGVVFVDVFDTDAPATLRVACSGTVVATSLLLWQWRGDRPVQQSTFLLGAAVFVASAGEAVSGWAAAGLLLSTLGAAMVAAAVERRIANPLLAEAVGAVGAVTGAFLIMGQWQTVSLVLAVLTAFTLLGLALVPGPVPERKDQVLLGIVGAVGMWWSVPSALAFFGSEGAIGTAAVLWLTGAGLVVVASRRLVRLPVLVELAGGAALLGGTALTGVEWPSAAPLLGIATAVTLVALGMLPGEVLLSLIGSIGLLVNVPWAIGRFFPGEARAPVLIFVSGALLVSVAVLLTRLGRRFRGELGRSRHQPPRAPMSPLHA